MLEKKPSSKGKSIVDEILESEHVSETYKKIAKAAKRIVTRSVHERTTRPTKVGLRQLYLFMDALIGPT